MKTLPQQLLDMSDLEQASIAGGNFAYDMGRAIRFLILTEYNGGPMPGAGVGAAVADWIANGAA
jgi:hypothetical protein